MSLKKAARINPFLIWCLACFYKIYLLTLRKKIVFSKEFQEHLKTKQPVLLAFWHQDVNTLLYISYRFKTMTMISDSKDGQIVAQLVEALGSIASRGSSRNNPIKALKSFIRIMRKGEHWGAIAVDGPKGPAKKPKAGIVESAKIFKCPIFAINVSYSNAWTFSKTWDQTKMPKPFSKISIHFGLGLHVDQNTDFTNLPQLLESLENSMSRNEKESLGKL